MKGGFNNPPNDTSDRWWQQQDVASMKGGFNNPPNQHGLKAGHVTRTGFNEGGVQ